MPNEHPVKLLAANIFDFIASLTVQIIHHACEYSCTCNWVTDGTVFCGYEYCASNMEFQHSAKAAKTSNKK